MNEFEARMKHYEELSAGQRLMPLLPTFARLDGRCFHNFTKGLNRPFDDRLWGAMIHTALSLMDETCALMGYTQSDEITLLWQQSDYKSQGWFDLRIHKMVSSLAALGTLYFNRAIQVCLPNYVSRKPTFDARVWQVPNRTEAVNVFLWREKDATRNSISMAAQSVLSHKELLGKNSKEQQEMLFQKGINWNDYPSYQKRGTYIQRRKVMRRFSPVEIEKLPVQHEARHNPNLMVERTEVIRLQLPPLASILNKEEVVFNGDPYEAL